METLFRILAPLVNLFTKDIPLRKMNYWEGETNLVIRLFFCLIALSLLGSLLFYLLGRKMNLRKNWQWFSMLLIIAAAQSAIMYNQIYEHVWFGDSTTALDIDYAFIFSPILILFLLYTAFSKIWLAIPRLTVFSIYTPSFLSKK